jgi:Zn-dependent membrane protease YugP
MPVDDRFDSWLLLALALLVVALLFYIVWLRLELWASRRVIAALELAEVREPKKARSSRSIVPALLAWSLLLLALGQALGYLFE